MNDAISRSAVLDQLQDYLLQETCGINRDVSDVGVGLEIALNTVKGAPAIDAAPVVHARWLYDDEDDRKNVECSHCHMRWAVVSDDPNSDYLVLHMTVNELLFCPSCGARMDGESE